MAFSGARRFRVSVQMLATVALLAGLAQAQASPNVAPQGSGFSPEEKSAFSYLILPEVSGPALKSPVKFLAEFTAPLQFPLAVNDILVQNGTLLDLQQIDSTSFAFSIDPSALQTSFSVQLLENRLKSSNGQYAAKSAPVTVFYDSLAPYLLNFFSETTSPSNVVPIFVVAEFSEDVIGLTKSQIAVSSGFVTKVTQATRSKYLIEIHPSSSSVTVNVNIERGVTKDLAGNGNTGSSIVSIKHDNARPAIASLTSTSTSPTSSTPITCLATFSEPVLQFTSDDVAVQGGYIAEFVSLAEAQYSLVIMPYESDTLIQVSIPEGSVVDYSGNLNLPSLPLRIYYDARYPSAVIAKLSTSDSQLSLAVEFDEPVFGFDPSDLTVSNATIVEFVAESNSRFALELLTTSTVALVSVKLAPGSVFDGAGNPNSLSEFQTNIDLNRPSVASIEHVSLTWPDSFRATKLPIRVLWSKPVESFLASSMTVEGASIIDWMKISSAEYRCTLSVDVTQPSVDIQLWIEEEATFDSHGNPNIKSEVYEFPHDLEPPRVSSMTSVSGNPTSILPIVVEIAFSEEVWGLEIGDILIEGGSIAKLDAESSSSYLAYIHPNFKQTFSDSDQQQIEIQVPQGAVVDKANLQSLASEALVISFNPNMPFIRTLWSPNLPTSITSLPFFSVEVIFSTAVKDFKPGGVRLSGAGATVANFNQISPERASFDVVLSIFPTESQVTVQISEGAALSEAGVPTVMSMPLVVSHDSLPPKVLSLSGVSTHAVVEAGELGIIEATLIFNEAVYGLSADKLSIIGGSILNMRSESNGAVSFKFEILPFEQDSEVHISLAANAVKDKAGNFNAASHSVVVRHDLIPPSAKEFKATESGIVTNKVFDVKLVFDEPIANLSSSAIEVIGGDLSSITPISSSHYVLRIESLVEEDLLEISVKKGTVQDYMGNKNTEAFVLVVRCDTLSPTLLDLYVTGFSSSNTSTMSIATSSPIIVVARFDEPVSHIGVLALRVEGAIVQPIDPSREPASEVLFSLYPTSSSVDVSVDLADGSFQDLAGNAVTRGHHQKVLHLRFDSDPPAVEFMTSPDLVEPTSRSMIPIQVKFTEAVIGFEIEDILVENGYPQSLKQLSPDVFEFDLVSTSPHDIISVSIAPMSVQDAAGWSNTHASSTMLIEFDAQPPRIVAFETMSRSSDTKGSIGVYANFSESVKFTTSHLQIQNAQLGDFEYISPGSYSFTLTPSSAQAKISIKVSKSVSDFANNTLLKDFDFNIFHDSRRTKVTLTTIASSPSATPNPIPVSIFFSKPVLDFNLDKLRIFGGVAGNLRPVSEAHTSFEFLVAPTNEYSYVSVLVPGDAVLDTNGNGNEASTPLTLLHDSSQPVSAIYTTSPNPGLSSSIPVAISFSKGVTELYAESLEVANGKISNFAKISDVLYTADVLATEAEADVVISLASGSVFDQVGNSNTLASLSLPYDSIRPEVTVSTSATSATSESPITVTASFTETVFGFDPRSVYVRGGHASNARDIDGEGRTFTVEITPASASTVVQVQIRAASAFDLANNSNVASNLLMITFSSNNPIAQLISNLPNGISQQPQMDFQLIFSEPVTGLGVRDIAVQGGSALDLQRLASSQTTYTFSVRATDESVKVFLPFDAVRSSATARSNKASNVVDVRFDAGPPRATLTAKGQDPRQQFISATIEFDEEVNGFSAAGVLVDQATLLSFEELVRNIKYGVVLAPISRECLVTLDIKEGTVFDVAGYPSSNEPLIVAVDSLSPEITSVTLNPARHGYMAVDVLFSEPVKSFELEQLEVSGARIKDSSLLVMDPQRFSFMVEPTGGDSTVAIFVHGGTTTDNANNGNLPSQTFTFSADDILPSVQLLAAAVSTPTAMREIPVDIAFSKPVGFVESGITVTGASISKFIMTSASNYHVVISPSSPSSIITLDIGEGVAVDALGNHNQAPRRLVVVHDSKRPTVLLQVKTPSLEPTNSSPIRIGAIFSEPIQGFDESDIRILNGRLVSFLQEGTLAYHIEIAPSSSPASVGVSIPERVVRDLAGNVNLASNKLDVAYDSEPPQVYMNTEKPFISSNEFSVQIRFTESVSTFSKPLEMDSNLVRQVGEMIRVSSTEFTIMFSIMDSSQPCSVELKVQAGSVTDIAGNPNLSSDLLVIEFDPIPPFIATFEASADKSGGIASSSPIQITVTFNEPVTELSTAGILLEKATARNLRRLSSKSYTFDVFSATSAGELTVQVLGASVYDRSGLRNAPSIAKTIIFDSVSPIVRLIPPSTQVSSESPAEALIQFSEEVNGLSLDMFDVQGCRLSRLTAFSKTLFAFEIEPISPLVQMTIHLPLAAAHDQAENPTLPSNTLSLYHDSVAPFAWFISPLSSPTAERVIPVTLIVTEDVLRFGLEKLKLTGCTARNLAPTTVTPFQRAGTSATGLITNVSAFSFNLIPVAASITISVELDPGALVDRAGNSNQDPVPAFTMAHDSSVLTVVSMYAEVFSADAEVFTVRAVFSKPVVFLDEVRATNASVSGIVRLSLVDFKFEVQPHAGKEFIEVAIPVGSVVSDSGLKNKASDASILQIHFGSLLSDFLNISTYVLIQPLLLDKTPPNAEILSRQASDTGTVTNLATIPMEARFSEDVVGLPFSAIQAENAIVQRFLKIEPNVFAFDLLPTVSKGEIRVFIQADKTRDAAGNFNLPSSVFSQLYDAERPGVESLNSLPLDILDSNVIRVLIKFTEPVYALSAEKIQVTNGSVTSLREVNDNSEYELRIEPSLESTDVIIRVLDSACFDNAMNPSTQSAELSISYDREYPTVILFTTSSNPTATSPILVQANFSEPVTGFGAEGVVVTGGYVSSFKVLSEFEYLFDITPMTSASTILIGVNSGRVFDKAGNPCISSTQLVILFDEDPPTIKKLSSSLPNPTSQSPIPLSVVFSEPVKGFSLSDIQVQGGHPSNIASISASRYTWDVTPSSASTLVTVQIKEGAVQDSAGNPSFASFEYSITYDSVVPVPSLTTESLRTNKSPFLVSLIFNDDVSGFSGDSVQVDNGRVAETIRLSPREYELRVVPSVISGDVVIFVPKGSAFDQAGNSNAQASPLHVSFDSVGPSVSQIGGLVTPTNLSPIPFSIVFSEPVSSFNIDDVTVTNATTSNFKNVNDSFFTFDATPWMLQTVVSAHVEKGKATDLSGNINDSPSDVFKVSFDSIRPRVAVTSHVATTQQVPTASKSIPVMAKFNEQVSGLELDDITVFGGTAENLVPINSSTYTFNIIPNLPRVNLRIDINAGGVQDLAGNENFAAPQLTIYHDSEPPKAVLSTTAGSPSSTNPIPCTIQWTEVVSGFDEKGIFVRSGSVENFRMVTPTKFTFEVVPSGISVLVSAGLRGAAAQDVSGNQNEETAMGDLLQIYHERSDLTAKLESPEEGSAPSSVFPIPFTLSFNKDVLPVAQTSLQVQNGTLSNFRKITSSIYEFEVVPTSPLSIISVKIADREAFDSAGNPSSAASITVHHDSVPPSVLWIRCEEENPTATSPLQFSIEFSESIVRFKLSMLNIFNGTAINLLKKSETTLSFDVIPTLPEAVITVSLPAQTVYDLAENSNQAAASTSIKYDSIVPEILLFNEFDSLEVVKASSFFVLLAVSEDIEIALSSILTVKGGRARSLQKVDTLSQFAKLGEEFQFVAAGGSAYSFELIPSQPSGLITAHVGASAFQDRAGNPNSRSNMIQILYDSSSPFVESIAHDLMDAPKGWFGVEIAFSEPVSTFEFDELRIEKAHSIDGNQEIFVYPDGKTFRLLLEASGPDVLVKVTVPDGIVTDAAGNRNFQPEESVRNSIEIRYDTIAPVLLSITAENESPSSASPLTFIATFSEGISELNASSVVVSGGTATTFHALEEELNPARSVFSFHVVPSSSISQVTVAMSSNVQDLSGNLMTSSDISVTILHDSKKPVIQYLSSAEPTSRSIIQITAFFDEPVFNFNLSRVQVQGATVDKVEVVSSTQYRLFFVPVADFSLVLVSLAGGVAFDSAGNANLPSDELAVIFDQQNPNAVARLTGPNPFLSPNKALNVPLTLVLSFNEPVQGFTAEDIDVANAELSQFSQLSSSEYICTLLIVDYRPELDSVPVLTMKAGVAFDMAGNGNSRVRIQLPEDLSLTAQPTNFIPQSSTMSPTDAPKSEFGAVVRPVAAEVWSTQKVLGTGILGVLAVGIAMTGLQLVQVKRLAADQDEGGQVTRSMTCFYLYALFFSVALATTNAVLTFSFISNELLASVLLLATQAGSLFLFVFYGTLSANKGGESPMISKLAFAISSVVVLDLVGYVVLLSRASRVEYQPAFVIFSSASSVLAMVASAFALINDQGFVARDARDTSDKAQKGAAATKALPKAALGAAGVFFSAQYIAWAVAFGLTEDIPSTRGVFSLIWQMCGAAGFIAFTFFLLFQTQALKHSMSQVKAGSEKKRLDLVEDKDDNTATRTFEEWESYIFKPEGLTLDTNDTEASILHQLASPPDKAEVSAFSVRQLASPSAVDSSRILMHLDNGMTSWHKSPSKAQRRRVKELEEMSSSSSSDSDEDLETLVQANTPAPQKKTGEGGVTPARSLQFNNDTFLEVAPTPSPQFSLFSPQLEGIATVVSPPRMTAINFNNVASPSSPYSPTSATSDGSDDASFIKQLQGESKPEFARIEKNSPEQLVTLSESGQEHSSISSTPLSTPNALQYYFSPAPAGASPGAAPADQFPATPYSATVLADGAMDYLRSPPPPEFEPLEDLEDAFEDDLEDL